MINNELYIMSSKELERKEILDRVIRRELTQVNAAKLLKVSDRRVRKLVANYKKLGVTAIISKKRGKPSNRAFTSEFKANVIGLVKTKYPDFGPTFAAEKLLEVTVPCTNQSTFLRARHRHFKLIILSFLTNVFCY